MDTIDARAQEAFDDWSENDFGHRLTEIINEGDQYYPSRSDTISVSEVIQFHDTWVHRDIYTIEPFIACGFVPPPKDNDFSMWKYYDMNEFTRHYFNIVNVSGDGHCLMYSFQVALFYSLWWNAPVPSIDDLKVALRAEMLEGEGPSDQYNGFYDSKNGTMREAMDIYLDDCIFDNSVVDIVPHALAKIYNVTIVIVDSGAKFWQNISHEGSNPTHTVFLERYRDHYSAYVPKKNYTCRSTLLMDQIAKLAPNNIQTLVDLYEECIDRLQHR